VYSVACVGKEKTDVLSASYNLLLHATMQAKECDEEEAVADIIHVSQEIAAKIQEALRA
jgi:hypothetical protein